MSASFHFVFEIFKIAIQAAIYSSVILILKFFLTAITGNSRLKLIKFNTVFNVIAGLMFIFSFTYYGNHGLGDDANIPLGHGKTMLSSDGYPYIYLEPNRQVNVDSFLVRNDYLCFTSSGSYYDYQLASGKLNSYKYKQDYETYASAHNLPLVNEFKTFYPQYDTYWNGWRFWLLP